MHRLTSRLELKHELSLTPRSGCALCRHDERQLAIFLSVMGVVIAVGTLIALFFIYWFPYP